MKRMAALLAIGLWSLAAAAQWKDETSGKPMAEEDWRKTVDGLGGMLMVTAKYEDFMKEWTESGDTYSPKFRPALSAKRGDSVTALILFAGCAKAGDTCQLEADFKVTAPDGSTYGTFKNIKAFDGKVKKDDNTVMLSRATIRLKIEPKDPLGEYTIVATLRQPSTGKAVVLRRTLQVME